MRIGSLFSGYGGLDLGIQEALGGTVAWHCEFDDAPSAILEHNFPDVPNYKDVTTVDWTQVEPVDILTGGFPCQDVSLAGSRRGLKDGTRSGLWSEFAKAIETLQPGLVVIENVRGLLSANADSGVEYPAEILEYAGTRSILNAATAVLGDLADLGYNARWKVVRASDAGAAHRRERVFIIAYPSSERSRGGRNAPRGLQGWQSLAKARLADISPRGTYQAQTLERANTDSERQSLGEHGSDQDWSLWQPQLVSATLGTITTNTDDAGRQELRRTQPTRAQQSTPERTSATPWGEYTEAIERWEYTIGRPAPAPTTDGKLSPVFVEWLMGLPTGWITDPAIGITRNQQLKACGNGVVPQQATLAIRELLA